jgi:hypothetical protein
MLWPEYFSETQEDDAEDLSCDTEPQLRAREARELEAVEQQQIEHEVAQSVVRDGGDQAGQWGLTHPCGAFFCACQAAGASVVTLLAPGRPVLAALRPYWRSPSARRLWAAFYEWLGRVHVALALR